MEYEGIRKNLADIRAKRNAVGNAYSLLKKDVKTAEFNYGSLLQKHVQERLKDGTLTISCPFVLAQISGAMRYELDQAGRIHLIFRNGLIIADTYDQLKDEYFDMNEDVISSLEQILGIE